MKTDRIQGIIFTESHQAINPHTPKHATPAKFITARLKSLIFPRPKSNAVNYSNKETSPSDGDKKHIAHTEADGLIVDDLFTRLGITHKDD